MLLLLTGCTPRMPSASLDGIALVAADLDHAEAEIRIAVDNPLPVDLELAGIRWEAAVRERVLAQGSVAEPQPLPAGAVTVVAVPASVRFVDLGDAYGDGVRGAPYRVTAEVDVATRLGPWTLPVDHRGTVPVLEPPTLDLVDVGFGVDGTALRLDLALRVGLPEGVRLSELVWTVATPEAVLARGSAAVDGEGTLVLRAWLDPMQASAAAARALIERRGEVRVDLTGTVATPIGTVPVAVARTFSAGDDP